MSHAKASSPDSKCCLPRQQDCAKCLVIIRAVRAQGPLQNAGLHKQNIIIRVRHQVKGRSLSPSIIWTGLLFTFLY